MELRIEYVVLSASGRSEAEVICEWSGGGEVSVASTKSPSFIGVVWEGSERVLFLPIFNLSHVQYHSVSCSTPSRKIIESKLL